MARSLWSSSSNKGVRIIFLVFKQSMLGFGIGFGLLELIMGKLTGHDIEMSKPTCRVPQRRVHPAPLYSCLSVFSFFTLFSNHDTGN